MILIVLYRGMLLIHLTLIVPGEIEVDLAHIDVKFPRKFFGFRFKKKYLFLQKRLPNLFDILT
jgi:hypothetical protein